MPVQPTPFLLYCKTCHWRQLFAPLSDVLVELPPEQCPQCQGRLKCIVVPNGLASIAKGIARWRAVRQLKKHPVYGQWLADKKTKEKS